MAAAHAPSEEDWVAVGKHYRALAGELGPRVGWPGGADAAGRLLAETANLMAVLTPSLEYPEPHPALDAVHALVRFTRHTGVELHGLFDRALDIARDSGMIVAPQLQRWTRPTSR